MKNIDPSDTETIKRLVAIKYGRAKFIQDVKALSYYYVNNIVAPEILNQNNQDSIIVDVKDNDCTFDCDFCHGEILYRYYHCSRRPDYVLCLDC